MKKIAILLSGAGWKDGTNPFELAFIIRALEATNMSKPIACAPNSNSKYLINYTNDGISNETRNILSEASRLLFDPVVPLSTVQPSEIDGLIIPGGEGVIYNLSNFAIKGINAEIDETVKRLIQGVYLRSKPIGILGYGGILPIIALQKVTSLILTIGKDTAAAGKLEKIGAVIIKASADELVFDDENNLLSAHGISVDSSICKTAIGVEHLVSELVNFKKQKR